MAARNHAFFDQVRGRRDQIGGGEDPPLWSSSRKGSARKMNMCGVSTASCEDSNGCNAGHVDAATQQAGIDA